MHIPLGEFIETFINWLKSALGPFFNAVSDILDFAISVLENILLLDHTKIYPSIAFALLVGLVIGIAVYRKWQLKPALIAAAVGVVVFGGLEIWRYSALEDKLSLEEIGQMETTLSEVRSSLQSIAPEDYDEAREVVQKTIDALPSEAEDGSDAMNAARRAAEDARRTVNRLRSERYARMADELEDLDEAVSATKVDQDVKEAVKSTLGYYKTLSLIDENERLADRFGRMDEPVKKIDAINQRTYDRYSQLLVAMGEELPQFEALGLNLQDSYAKLVEQFNSINPNRLSWYAWLAMTLFLTAIAWLIASRKLAALCLFGLLLIVSMGFWVSTMETLALVLSATIFALLTGVPLGILSAQSEKIDGIVKPILDFMQTMPAFVYLIPAVILFGLGKVPGAMATLIFAMPPAVRLTSLGIRQVPAEVVEAAQAFGSTKWQLLFKAQLPIAMPTILAGLNQTIMLSLSMVVIGGMIGAGGLGEDVLSGITQLKIGLGFESGISVVILAIYLDRITQAMGVTKKST